jgi:hypothetical protein
MAEHGLRTVHILLIEDNKDFAKLVRLSPAYEKDRFDVTWKENHDDGGGADAAALRHHPHGPLPPGKNGLEITKEIKERKIGPGRLLTVNRELRARPRRH